MKIGLYGGTFDPIHHGHLILARDAMETLALDRVIFIPAARSPHKPNAAEAPAPLRLKMLKAAIGSEPLFSVDDCEIRRAANADAPSYTIDTILKLREEFANDELFYFIGDDNLAKLPTWHRIDELLKLVRFVILSRGEPQSTPLTASFPRITHRIEISATDIRSRIAKGASIRYLVPENVLAIITHDRIYQPKLGASH